MLRQLTSLVEPDKEHLTLLCCKKKTLRNIYKDAIYVDSKDKEVLPTYDNGFLNTVITAYNKHLNLRIKPDHIWFLICQGIITHINNNHESLRNIFVPHTSGKQKLTGKGLVYEQCISNIISQIRETSLQPNFIDILSHNFTTTDSTCKVAGNINIMCSMKNYFVYEIVFTCGIPNIIMEGTLDDWKTIAENISILKKFKGLNLNWWFNDLEVIINEFINTYQGNVNQKFWSNIMDIENEWGSGVTSYISGWITKFFPYSGNKKRQFKEKHNFQSIPRGMSIVEFEDNLGNQMQYVSGFQGICVDLDTCSISPNIVWYVCKNTEKKEGNMQKEDVPNQTCFNADVLFKCNIS